MAELAGQLPHDVSPEPPPAGPPSDPDPQPLSIRTREDALHLVHNLVINKVKEWELLVCEWLALDPRAEPRPGADAKEHLLLKQRLRILSAKRNKARTQLRDNFFRKLSARAWSGSAPPPARHNLVPPQLQSHVPQRTRQPRFSCESDSSESSASSGASSRLSIGSDASFTYSLCSSGSTLRPARGRGEEMLGWHVARAFNQAHNSIYTDPVRAGMRLQEAAVCGPFTTVTRFVVLELHVPGGPMSIAGLEWLPEDSVKPSHVIYAFDLYPAAPCGDVEPEYSRRAHFWLANQDSGPGSISIEGAPPSTCCRGLELEVEISELPAEVLAAAAAAGRPTEHRFRCTRIISAQWVPLRQDAKDGRRDCCVELDAKTDIENEDPDELVQSDDGNVPESVPGVAAFLASGALMSYSKTGQFNGFKSFAVEFMAPRRSPSVLEPNPRAVEVVSSYCPSHWLPHTRADEDGDPMDVDDAPIGDTRGELVGSTVSGVSTPPPVPQPAGDETEELVKMELQIDCSVVANASFVVRGGMENVRIPSDPDRNLWDMPVWKYRAP